MSAKCSIHDCDEINYNTTYYTVDWGAIRYFCNFHWEEIRLLFNKIAMSKCNLCTRNHRAETDNAFFIQETVKYNAKYWDLCTKHLLTYEDLIDYFELPDD